MGRHALLCMTTMIAVRPVYEALQSLVAQNPNDSKGRGARVGLSAGIRVKPPLKKCDDGPQRTIAYKSSQLEKCRWLSIPIFRASGNALIGRNAPQLR
jgi:hypothetical protein